MYKKRLTYSLFVLFHLAGSYFLISSINGRWLPLSIIAIFLLVVCALQRHDNRIITATLLIIWILASVYGLGKGLPIWIIIWQQLGLVLIWFMIKWYISNTLYLYPLSVTVRATKWFTLGLATSTFVFITVNFSIDNIDCQVISSVVESHSDSINTTLQNTTILSTVRDLSKTSLRQQNIQSYWNQLWQTREQKQSINSQVCGLFISSIHQFTNKTEVQLGGNILLFILLYTILFVPLLFIAYIFALSIQLLLWLGYLRRTHSNTTCSTIT